MKFNWVRALPLVGFVLVAELAGILGSVFTAPQIGTWYAGLVKPELAPPNWVFAPVWTTLFALMGVAAYLVWRRGAGAARRLALTLFFVQLALNALWSFIFFGSTSLTINGLNNIGVAFIEITVLWLAILATILAFRRISRTAAWLLAPYLLWVTWAAYLNYRIWTLNP